VRRWEITEALERDCIYRASFKVDERTYFGQGRTKLEALENLADFLGVEVTRREYTPTLITIKVDEDGDA
jgi:hypothetical protein